MIRYAHISIRPSLFLDRQLRRLPQPPLILPIPIDLIPEQHIAIPNHPSPKLKPIPNQHILPIHKMDTHPTITLSIRIPSIYCIFVTIPYNVDVHWHDNLVTFKQK